MLAQECFSDRCDSETRKEILLLVANRQKGKYEKYTNPSCTQKSGVFLMAVILAKEREKSAAFIDAATLQQALLCWSSDANVSEDFSKKIIGCSEALINNKNNQDED